MFKDRNEELQRLEEALLKEDQTMVFTPVQEPVEDDDTLLAEETLDELLDDMSLVIDSVPYQNYSNDYGQIYNTDMTDEDPEELSEEILEEPAPASYKGLIVLACLLALGILGMVIYLLIRGGGAA